MPPENSSSKQKKILLTIGCFILLLIGLGLYISKSQKSQETTTPENMTQQDQAPTLSPEVAFSFTPTSQNISPNTQFSIKLTLDSHDIAVTGVDVSIPLDTRTVEFISFTPGKVLNTPLINDFNAASQTIRFSAVDTSTTEVKGNLELGTLTLRAKSGEGQVSLNKSQVTASGRTTAIPSEILAPAKYSIQ